MGAFDCNLQLLRGEPDLHVNIVTSGAQFAEPAFG
jgi:hypothetical protein